MSSGPNVGSSPQDDVLLLERWSAGCPDSGDRFVGRHFAWLQRFFRKRVRDPRILEDLIQQTFLAWMEAYPRFRGEASFRTFQTAIARHVWLRFLDQRKREGHGTDPGSLACLDTSPTGRLAKGQHIELLAQAMRGLSSDAREILTQAYWEDANVVDIAKATGVPANTAYSRLRRAKVALREELGRLLR